MRGKSIALLVLALGCGLVASLGITQVLAKRGDATPPLETVPVCVATADIGDSAFVTKESCRIEQWPKGKAPPDVIGKVEDLDARRTRIPILAGQPIMNKMLFARNEEPVQVSIPMGMRVVSVPVDPVSTNGGLVKPGARCDVQLFIRSDSSLGIAETLSKTILQDIRVFAVDNTTNDTHDPAKPSEQHNYAAAKTVSLLVTPAQSEIVTLASQLGTLRLNLRNPDDKEQPKVTPIAAVDLLNLTGHGRGARGDEDPEPAKDKDRMDKLTHILNSTIQAATSTAKVEEPAKYKIRMRLGTQVTDVVLVADASAGGSDDDGGWTPIDLPVSSHPGGDSRVSRTIDTVSPTANGPAGDGTAPKVQPVHLPQKPPMGS